MKDNTAGNTILWSITISVCGLIIGMGCGSTPRPTDQTTSGKRYYAQCQQEVNDVIGARSTIRTRYGKLIGSAGDTTESFTWTYCGLGKKVDDLILWGQTGYVVYRVQDDDSIYYAFYCEVMNDASGIVDSWYSNNYAMSGPAQNSLNTYSCEVNTTEGEWSFVINGQAVDKYENTWYDQWMSPAIIVTWTCEISNDGNDMSGTMGPDSTCKFIELWCKQQGDSDYGYVYYDGNGVYHGTDNDDEWGIAWDTLYGRWTEVRIWDRKPIL
jgi:hypothetical protein